MFWSIPKSRPRILILANQNFLMESEIRLKNKRNRNPYLFAPLPLPVNSGPFSVSHTAVGEEQATVLSQPMISFSDTFVYKG